MSQFVPVQSRYLMSGWATLRTTPKGMGLVVLADTTTYIPRAIAHAFGALKWQLLAIWVALGVKPLKYGWFNLNPIKLIELEVDDASEVNGGGG
jgi:hypothetical protein